MPAWADTTDTVNVITNVWNLKIAFHTGSSQEIWFGWDTAGWGGEREEGWGCGDSKVRIGWGWIACNSLEGHKYSCCPVTCEMFAQLMHGGVKYENTLGCMEVPPSHPPTPWLRAWFYRNRTPSTLNLYSLPHFNIKKGTKPSLICIIRYEVVTLILTV